MRKLLKNSTTQCYRTNGSVSLHSGTFLKVWFLYGQPLYIFMKNYRIYMNILKNKYKDVSYIFKVILVYYFFNNISYNDLSHFLCFIIINARIFVLSLCISKC